MKSPNGEVIMTSSKYNKIKNATTVGKYPDTFETCLNMIPEEIKNALPWYQVAQLVDIINRSYESGHTAGYREMA